MSEEKGLSFLQKAGLYTAMGVTKLVTKSFFRNVKVFGHHNLYTDEPTIICANHSNQFMDAINLIAYLATIDKPIKFLIAAKSYRRPLIGEFARLAQCIPVERAQDLAKGGKGVLVSIKDGRIRGKGTEFSKATKKGESISIKQFDDPILIKEVVSDEELVIASVPYEQEDGELAYKILPKIDQSEIYAKVSDSLNNDDIIGIFPEGGSSDRTDLLPLKAGVCIMAMEAMVKYNKPVNIVCVGINYFKPHKFRSRVIMDIGVPYKIPMEFIDQYKKSRRDVIAKLLGQINLDMRSVIYPAPSYEELTSILMARKIYIPENRILSPHEELELNKRFSKGYQLLKDTNEIQMLVQQLSAYRQALKILGISDRELKKIKKNTLGDLYYFLSSLITFLINFSFAMPGWLLNYPVGYVLSELSIKERKKCLKASKVKVKGNDVVASHQVKLGLVFLPLYHLFFSICLYYVLFLLFNLSGSDALLYAFLFFVIYPFYSYRMLKATDRFMRCFKNMKARMVLLFSFNQVKSLREKRRELKDKINGFVNAHVSDVIGEDQERIINQDRDSKPTKETNKIAKKKLENQLNDQQLEEAFHYLKELGI